MKNLVEDIKKIQGKSLTEMSSDQEDLLKTIVMAAENEGDFYKKKDAKGAVAKVIKEHKKRVADDLDYDLKAIEKKAVKEIAAGWRKK